MDLEYKKGILFVRLYGNLSRRISIKINDYLIPVILKHKIKYLVYNLCDLKKLDSYGVNAILNTRAAINTNKGKIMMCEVSSKFIKDLRKLRIKRVDNERMALSLIQI